MHSSLLTGPPASLLTLRMPPTLPSSGQLPVPLKPSRPGSALLPSSSLETGVSLSQVVSSRMASEYGCEVKFEPLPYQYARWAMAGWDAMDEAQADGKLMNVRRRGHELDACIESALV